MPAGHKSLLSLVLSALLLSQSTIMFPSSVSAATDEESTGELRSDQRAAATGERPSSSPVNTSEFLRAYEASLLKLLGMQKKPRPSGMVYVPPYMLDIYDSIKRTEGRRAGSVRRPLHGANTIRSFYHKDVETSTEQSSPANSQHMMFDISSISHDEVLKAAELRLFRSATDTPVNSTESHHQRTHRLDVYEVLRSSAGRGGVMRRLLATRSVDVRHTAWESFDVWPAVQRWRQRPTANHGIMVDFVTATGHATSLRHVRLRRSVTERVTEQVALDPVMVTYGDDQKEPKRRTKRGSRRRARGRKRQRQRKNHCSRHPLYVDFSDVGWNDWIIAPPGYKAHYCHGECPFFLPEHLNSTNHAIVQTLVNSVNAAAVPRPCCVPTELSPISMLYLNEYDKVILKNYQDMVVESCGCR